MIELVYFDVGGTILAPHPSVGAVYAAAGAPYGLTAPPEALDRAFAAAWAARTGSAAWATSSDMASTRAWWRELVSEVLAAVAYTGDHEACFDACFRAFARPEAWHVFADVAPTLSALAQLGVRAGVLSNWDYRLPPLLEALGLAARFDPILVSAELGAAKPDPEVYRIATARAGLPPERILHVGDSRVLDVEPARAAGLHALLIDRRGRARTPHETTTLLDVVDHVRWINGGKGAGRP